MIIVRYEGPSGAPGMPEMLDPTSRITTLCRERGIVVALMTDARFSGGSVGLVIGHVGPEAALGGPIAFVEDGDEIVADLNKNELNCTALADPAVLKQRKATWEKVVADNGGIHPNCGIADTRLLHRARLTAVPATRGGGLHPNREVWVREPREGNAVRLRADEQAPAGDEEGVLERFGQGWRETASSVRLVFIDETGTSRSGSPFFQCGSGIAASRRRWPSTVRHAPSILSPLNNAFR